MTFTTGGSITVNSVTPPPWSPLDLSPTVWIDASVTSSITVASNLASQIDDLSGNARHVTQATSANKPGSGVDTLNGLNVLTFDGTTDFMQGTSGLGAQPFTLFCVAKNTAAAAQRNVMIMRVASGEGRIYERSDGNIGMYAGSAEISSGVAWGTTVAHSVSAVIDGASSKIVVDGGTATTGNPGANNPETSWTLGSYAGASEFWSGVFGEAFLVNSAVSDAGVVLAHAYFAGKWL